MPGSLRNPFTTTFPAYSLGTITAVAKAAYNQRVVITIKNQTTGKEQISVFEGVGEDQKMLLPSGEDSVTIHQNPHERTAEFLFLFATTGDDGWDWVPSSIDHTQSASGDTKRTIWINTEDSTDQDTNDTVVTIQLETPGHHVQAGEERKSSLRSRALSRILLLIFLFLQRRQLVA